MKSVVTPLISLLMIGALIAVSMLGSIGHKDFGILGWCLIILAVLLAAWLIATLLNIAIFFPVYRLLGRWQSRKNEAEAKHNHDA